VELPAAANLAEITFESPAGTTGFGIGSLGGGASGVGGGNSTLPQAGGGGGRGAAQAQPATPPGFYPRGFTIQVSTDGTRWSTPPVAQGQGAPGLTVASFKPVQTRFVRITATTADAQAWSMKNLRLFTAGR
jgi:hypothetical protein